MKKTPEERWQSNNKEKSMPKEVRLSFLMNKVREIHHQNKNYTYEDIVTMDMNKEDREVYNLVKAEVSKYLFGL